MYDILRSRLNNNFGRVALIAFNKYYSYQALAKEIEKQELVFYEKNVGEGSIVVLVGDFSLISVASLLALFFAKSTVIPLTREAYLKLEKYVDLLTPDFIYDTCDLTRIPILTKTSYSSKNLEWRRVLPLNAGSLVVYTSGSTGIPKAIVHNIDSLCYRYLESRKPLISICFLLFDHLGGINTLFFVLFHGGTAVHISGRKVDEVCKAIEDYKVELLPTTPSFLAQLLMAKCYNRYNLSSLKVISYGTEVMSDVILFRLNDIFPNCTFKQTYGLSEIGVLQILSKDNRSLWFKFRDPGVEFKIESEVLWIKTASNLLAKVLFTDNTPVVELPTDNWFCTDDLVVMDNEYLKILGRKTDIINVGGLKVYPSEVENCIYRCKIVDDVVVKGKNHPLLGQMVIAHVQLNYDLDKVEAVKILRRHCLDNLDKYKVPSQFILRTDEFVNDRFKKIRVETF